MTDQTTTTDVSAAVEDRTLPAVVYGLYLLAFATLITAPLGAIVAYAQRSRAGAKMRTHYDFQVRTFWMTLAWCAIGGLLFIFGLPLSFVLIGLPMLALSWVIWGLVGVWFAVRCVLGVIHLARDEAYPRPHTWLV
jgi:uncharacterized membrane protein